MAFKMSQEFLTTSLDITDDFHILHSAYVLICYAILKAKTYNWLPNTHTHTHTWPATTTNKKQLGTSHLLLMVISLAQTLLSYAKFRPLRVIKKEDIILLTLDWQWGCLTALLQWKNVSLKRSRWFGKRHKTDAFTKLGEPTIRAAWFPEIVYWRRSREPVRLPSWIDHCMCMCDRQDWNI